MSDDTGKPKFDKIKKSPGYDHKTHGRGQGGKDIPFDDAVEAIGKAHQQDIDPRNRRPRFWGLSKGYKKPLRVIGSVTTSAGAGVLRVFNVFQDRARKRKPPEPDEDS